MALPHVGIPRLPAIGWSKHGRSSPCPEFHGRKLGFYQWTINDRWHEQFGGIKMFDRAGHDDCVVFYERPGIEQANIRKDHRHAFGNAIDAAIKGMPDMDICK